jgi:soluble lytic murein transglycosylase-like protein
MSKFGFGLVALCATVFLAGCQTAQLSGTSSSFASPSVSSDPVKKRVEPGRFRNEAASSIVKPTQQTQNTKVAGLPPNEAGNFLVKRPGGQNVSAKKPVAKKKVVKAKSKSGSKKVAKVRYTKGPSFQGRRGRYSNLIAKHARAAGVPVRLALAVVEVESGFRPNARGRAGEIGMMQILPRTARFIGYKGRMKNLYNPSTNLKFGMKYLGKAYRLGGKTTCGAILKYNAGHGAKKMNPISREYCRRVSRIMRRG